MLYYVLLSCFLFSNYFLPSLIMLTLSTTFIYAIYWDGWHCVIFFVIWSLYQLRVHFAVWFVISILIIKGKRSLTVYINVDITILNIFSQNAF